MARDFPIRQKTADLIPYAKNSRTHSEEQIAQIAASIKEFGFTNPIIIDENNGIIAGPGRILAAQKLKLKEVPCVQVTGWTDVQKKRLRHRGQQAGAQRWMGREDVCP